MSNLTIDTIRYSIWDPTGNITALVETEVPIPEQPAAAAAVMERHPEVEQVGFVDFTDGVRLRMAGGEFCGNATMSAAALRSMTCGTDGTSVTVRVSGVDGPVQVDLCSSADEGEAADRYHAAVHMPAPLSVEEIDLQDAQCPSGERLPLVRLPGIAHLIVGSDSSCYSLLNDREKTEAVIRRWCDELGAASLGIIFLDELRDCPDAEKTRAYRAVPLVCVPQSGTVFWEHSCASGSAACAAALARSTGADADITLIQPGGTMRVCFDRGSGRTLLRGTTRLIRGGMRIRL